jgi:hypothetical protein
MCGLLFAKIRHACYDLYREVRCLLSMNHQPHQVQGVLSIYHESRLGLIRDYGPETEVDETLAKAQESM